MKKLTLLGVMVVLCVCGKSFCQSNAVDLRTIKAPLYIDDWVRQDMPLGKFINYKSNTATLKDFEGKMLIIGFWFTTCTSCIAQFPKEDSIQKLYDKDIQLVLATFEPKERVTQFISNWEKRNNRCFNLPIIVEDTILRKAFNVHYNPSYTWLLPGGKYVAQTSEHLLNNSSILSLVPEIENFRQFMDIRGGKATARPIATLKPNR